MKRSVNHRCLGLSTRVSKPQFPTPSKDRRRLRAKLPPQAYKNIQILKDIPADQLIPSIQFIAASLGVGCNFCHVEHAFEKHDKKRRADDAGDDDGFKLRGAGERQRQVTITEKRRLSSGLRILPGCICNYASVLRSAWSQTARAAGVNAFRAHPRTSLNG